MFWILDVGIVTLSFLAGSDWYLEWLLAVAFVGGIAAPLNYRWVCQILFVLNVRMVHVEVQA